MTPDAEILLQTAPPSSIAELEDFLPYLVNRLASVGLAVQNRTLGQQGINTVMLRTLSVLHITNGLTVNEIAVQTFVDQSTASRTIDAMAASGWVERRIPETDMRRREIILTEAGRKLLRDCWPLMEGHCARLTDGIHEADLAACRRVLARMTDNLRQGES
ncbi:MarR family winged helix-turn-helix transcriptional regulator [Sphingobium cloacae]|uniref:MarR family protein n=1 Tax=Sphingobium cloacae TaxID=120107 RepID=A0A1E1EYR6_9SPHN|nr:MarR family winged helix-turn-helix transcriptional regulator [Sphingobium cloacae]BAV63352.1 MarR family protein [Sphingobium cloacae]